jgi:hypothetical protein
MAGRASPGRDHSFRSRRGQAPGLTVAGGGIFYFLFTRVDVAGVWTKIRAMTWFELATIAAVAGWNLMTYWALWVAVTPGLTWPQALVFRALTWLLPVPIGAVTYLAWRRRQAQRRSSAQHAPPVVPVEPGAPSR